MVDFVRVGFQNVFAGMPWYPYHIILYDVTQDYNVNVRGHSERNDLSKTFIIDLDYLGSTASPDGKTVSESDYLGTGILVA